MKAGENIFMAWGQQEINGKDPVHSWYSEIDQYTYGDAQFSFQTGQKSKKVFILQLIANYWFQVTSHKLFGKVQKNWAWG